MTLDASAAHSRPGQADQDEAVGERGRHRQADARSQAREPALEDAAGHRRRRQEQRPIAGRRRRGEAPAQRGRGALPAGREHARDPGTGKVVRGAFQEPQEPRRSGAGGLRSGAGRRGASAALVQHQPGPDAQRPIGARPAGGRGHHRAPPPATQRHPNGRPRVSHLQFFFLSKMSSRRHR